LATNAESIEARIGEMNDAIQVLGSLVTKDFAELTIYEKLSMRYLVIQLVEAAYASKSSSTYSMRSLRGSRSVSSGYG
jgi:hypothetical protein